MRHFAWLVVGMIAAGGCGAAYEPQAASPADQRPADTRPAASPSRPGCQETAHQPFPSGGSYVQVDELAEPISKVQPDYPTNAREGRAQGTVLVRALVCEHGRVVKTEIVQSIPLLDEAAMTSVMQWTFRPARSGGNPVAVWVDTPIRFTLN